MALRGDLLLAVLRLDSKAKRTCSEHRWTGVNDAKQTPLM
jgi:hypothetical protein